VYAQPPNKLVRMIQMRMEMSILVRMVFPNLLLDLLAVLSNDLSSSEKHAAQSVRYLLGEMDSGLL